MHASVAEFIRRQVAELDLAGRSTLEVASFAESAAPAHCPTRACFHGAFVGVDRRAGPNVDHVAEAADLPFADDAFQVVVCTEMLEHDDAPWRSLDEMHRVLAPGGTLLLTARGFDERGCYPVHDHPVDYWRFSPTVVPVLLAAARFVGITVEVDPEAPGFFAVAHV
jgi:SAM-dependent methyltransferase